MDIPVSRALKVGAWRVDSVLDRISRDGRELALEPRTMRLLRFLAQRPDEVVSIEEILDEVWSGVVVTPESVYQAIGALRRALGELTDGKPYIVTAPRRGYRLIAPVARWEDTETAPLAGASPSPVDPKSSTSATTASTAQSPTSRGHLLVRRGALVMLSVLAVGLLGGVAIRLRTPSPAAATLTRDAAVRPAPALADSIAVLPFEDLSPGRDQQYLADGMAEELIASLAQTPGLHVLARTSSFAIRNGGADLGDIARKLHVDLFLEGSIRRSDNTLRVTTKLVRADTGFTIWSQSYERTVDNLFSVQDEISAAVVESLKLALASNRHSENARRTHDPEAHIQYLLAREFIRRGTLDGWRRAIEALDRATALDPAYAAAYAARVGPATNLYDFTDDKRWLQRAETDADRAIALAPALADGYAARAELKHWYHFDWAGAKSDLDQALAIDPQSADIHIRYAYLMASLGRISDAVAAQKKAVDADPLSADTWRILAFFLTSAHDYGGAAEAISRSLQIEPQGAYALSDVGQLRLLQGEYASALQVFNRVSLGVLRLRGLAATEFSLGHREKAARLMREMIARYQVSCAYQIADVYAWEGDFNAAFRWFDRAYQQHDPGLVHLQYDPLLEKIRAEPRFAALLERMQLPR